MNKYILFNPGPVNLHPLVRKAAISNDLCHRQEEFTNILIRVKKKILKIAKKTIDYVSILHGSGTLAVESGIQNFIKGRVLVIVNGDYGNRIVKSLSNRDNFNLKILSYNFLEIPDVEEIGKELNAYQYNWVCLVHHETTTGILNPINRICDVAQKTGTRVFVDAVSSFPVHNINNNVDVICTNSNKCLESVPGAAIVIWKKNITVRDDVCDYMKLNMYIDKKIPYTPNTNAIMALDQALDLYLNENRPLRYCNLSKHIREIGSKYFPLLLDNNYSSVLTSFKIKEDKYDIIYKLAKSNGFIIYKGKYPGQFRVANMGYNINKKNIEDLFDCIRHA